MKERIPLFFLLFFITISKSQDVGKLKFAKYQNQAFDTYTYSPDSNMIQFLNDKFERMLAWTTYFDTRVRQKSFFFFEK